MFPKRDQINAVINSKLSRSLITVSTISVHSEYLNRTSKYWGTAVAQWLRCCATNWKGAGSIPDGVMGIFH